MLVSSSYLPSWISPLLGAAFPDTLNWEDAGGSGVTEFMPVLVVVSQKDSGPGVQGGGSYGRPTRAGSLVSLPAPVY